MKSLFARGAREVYTKKRDELRYIGMPVGGICCGTLYLGGDGKLWLWDIFNQNQEGILPQNVDWVDFSGQQYRCRRATARLMSCRIGSSRRWNRALR